MLIIIGTKEKTVKTGDFEESCPFCSGKLYIYERKLFFSLFFIPLFPVKHIESFIFCPDCNYKKQLK